MSQLGRLAPCPTCGPAGRALSSLGAVSAIPHGSPGSPFPPIADYGFLSDCETCVLIAPSGNVEWMCLPRMDSPSVFGRCSTATPAAFDWPRPA
jgi:hypothetical protein